MHILYICIEISIKEDMLLNVLQKDLFIKHDAIYL
jgi:hypothetical protein